MHAFIAISIPRRGYRPRDDILKTRASRDRKLDRRPRIRSSRSLINTVQSYSLHSRVHPPPFSSVSALLTFFFLPPRGVHVRIDKALDKERTQSSIYTIHITNGLIDGKLRETALSAADRRGEKRYRGDNETTTRNRYVITRFGCARGVCASA